MKRIIILSMLLFFTGSVNAEPVKITPMETISTSKKIFQLGNSYKFRNINTNEVYEGYVVYYRPNGMLGQEAQVEIANFTDVNGKHIPGKITIIPGNHKKFQEFMNYFTVSVFAFVRGSEICLSPNVHQFVLDETNPKNENLIILLKNDEPISTCNDELEVSDVVVFSTITDVYKNGQLYIKTNTKVYGIIDSIDENGWCADNASIYFKKFKTKDINNNKVIINADLTIDGFEILKYKSGRVKQFFNYCSTIVRGKEVDIKESDSNLKFVLISK